jgi:hydroxymethylpyrimidine pyrophosphatase-like HAD family hydrolase
MTDLLVFTDLDDTIFSSLEHFPGRREEELKLVSLPGQFQSSYMCERKDAILRWMSQGARIIPVTARAKDTYDDIQIPFKHGAVVSNGALILNPDGSEDERWNARMENELLSAREGLDLILSEIQKFDPSGEKFFVETFTTRGHAYGMTAKALAPDAAGLGALHQELLDNLVHTRVFDFVRHNQVGKYLGFVPHSIGKGPAVKYLLDTREDFQNVPTVGCGDANTDLEFMKLCDMMMVPTQSGNGDHLLR